MIVDNKTELEAIREKWKNKDGKIEYPKFFRELSRKGRYDSKKTYRHYNTTLDIIAYKRLAVKNDGIALTSILRKPDIKKRDINFEKIENLKKICDDRAKDDARLKQVKIDQGKSQYIKQRQLAVENFIDEIFAEEKDKKINQATLYTLLTDEEMQKNKKIDYLLQGLLEIGCTALKKLVQIEDKTPTLIEDKDGEYNLYGIQHKKEVA